MWFWHADMAAKDIHSFIQETSIVIYYVLLITVSEKPTTMTKPNAEPFFTGLESGWSHNSFCLSIITKDSDISNWRYIGELSVFSSIFGE